MFVKVYVNIIDHNYLKCRIVTHISDCEYSTNKKTIEDQINTKRGLDNIYDISDLECSTNKKHVVVKKKDLIIN